MNHEDRQRETPSGNGRNQPLSRALTEQREHARRYFATQQDKFARIERRLSEHLQQISQALTEENDQSSERNQQLEQQAESLAKQGQQLAKIKKDLEKRDKQWEREQEAAVAREQKLLEEIELRQQELANLQIELEGEKSALDERALRAEAQAAELAALRGTLDELDRELQRQSTAIHERAQSFEDREASIEELAAEVEQKENLLSERSASLDVHQKELDERHLALEAVQTDLAEREAFIAELERELAERQAEFASTNAALATLHDDLALQEEDLAAREALLTASQHQLAEERQQLAELQTQLEQNAAVLQQRVQQTEEQRSRIAAELSARRQRQIEEIEVLRGELQQFAAAEDARLQQQLATASQQHHYWQQAATEQIRRNQQLQTELASAKAELTEVRNQRNGADDATLEEMDRLAKERAAQAAEMQSLRQQLENSLAELSEQTGVAEDQRLLAQRCQQLEQELATRTAEIEGLHKQLDQHFNDSQTATGNSNLLERQLAEMREDFESQVRAAQVALSQARQDQESLREQLQQTRQQQSDSSDQLLQARQASEQSDAGYADLVAELELLREEREQMQAKLVEANNAAHHAEAASGGTVPADDTQLDDMRRRFEMAVEDIRDLKNRNAELEKQLSSSKKSGGALSPSSGNLNWEAMKRKLLEQLEDFDENDREEKADRLTVEGAIRITDQIVADKERELAEVKRQLEQRPAASAPALAVGAKAIAEMLDKDELIRQERESLVRLQEEWRDKLRKAEVDLSVERAKLGRDRAELEEALEAIQHSSRGNSGEAQGGDTDKDGKKPKKGRWLARLGLRGPNE